LEEGVSVVGFLVRADGTIGESVVFNSSGSRNLDRAAQEDLAKCVFPPATSDGKPVEMWVQVEYVWIIDDDPEMNRAKRTAAGKGTVASRYQLSMLLSSTAKTDADREAALVLLRSAADLGYAHAQFDLGRHYEKGNGLTADADEAMRWYRKSAAQGDVLAIQRLKVGPLPD
jgi:TonB family protein